VGHVTGRTFHEQLAYLSLLKAGWDSYDSAPPSRAALRRARYLRAVPMSGPGGGIQLELASSRLEVEIVIGGDGEIQDVLVGVPDPPAQGTVDAMEAFLGAAGPPMEPSDEDLRRARAAIEATSPPGAPIPDEAVRALARNLQTARHERDGVPTAEEIPSSEG
jgi:hypothetical protein